MISDTHNCTPFIFLITDGTVEDERHICDVIMNHLTDEKLTSPRLHTFGIGTYLLLMHITNIYLSSTFPLSLY